MIEPGACHSCVGAGGYEDWDGSWSRCASRDGFPEESYSGEHD